MKLELRKTVRFPKFLFRNFLLLWLVTCSFGLIAQTAAPTCPVAENVSVSAISTTSARINYTLSMNVYSATIVYSTSTNGDWISVDIFKTAKYQDLTNLTPGTKYYYRIRSVCEPGTVNITPGYSELKDFTTYPSSTCPAAENVSVGTISATSATINYNLSMNVSSAAIEYRTSGTDWKTVVISKTAHYWDLKDLSPSTTYIYRIKSVCEGNTISISNVYTTLKEFTTYPLTTCPVATALSVTDISASGVRINFSLTPNASAAVIEIYSPSAPNYVSKGSTTGNFFLLTGLTPATVYHYRIKSECKEGNPGYATGEFKTLAASDQTPIILTGKGKVKISTTGPCERLIILENGNSIIPVEMAVNFTFKDGQYVELTYELLKDRTTNCTAGIAAKISKITELIVTPELCKLAITVTKNGTNPESYTFKTSPQPEGSKYYWYFGDNGTSDAAAPTHTYAANSTYLINLKVLDKFGKVCYGEMKETFLGGTISTTLTVKGKVKISAGSVCEKMIVLDNKTVIVPLESVAFDYKDGQYVELTYELLKDRVTNCTQGVPAKIVKIYEIAVAPSSCPAAVITSVGELTATSARINFKLPAEAKAAILGILAADSKDWVTFSINSMTALFYDLRDLKVGTKYYYHLKTECATGSTVTTDAYFETKAAAVCAPASGVTVSEITASGARISYKLPPAFKDVAVQIRDANTNDWITIGIANLSSTYFDKRELKAGTKYAVKIKTVCTDGSINYSPEVLFATLGTTACTAAIITSVGELTATSARINFKLPAEAKAAILGIMASGSNNWVNFPINSMTAIYYDLKELKAGTKYYYHLKTECATGSAVTADAHFETKAAVLCTAASNVTVSEITSSSARINFTLPKEIAKASLEIKEYNTTTWLPSEFTSLTSTYFVRKELKAATKYYYHIKTVCANGSVNYSPDAYFLTAVATSVAGNCTAATGLSVTSIGPNGVKIIYLLPTGISSATLEVINANTSNTDASVWLSKNILIPSTYTERGDLLPATKYKYRIKTVCANGGTVMYSALGDFTTAASKTVAPSCVAYNVSVSDITTSGARINYKLPAEIITASLEIIASNTSIWLSFPIDNNSNYYLLSPLDPSTGYYYRIKTVCSDGTFSFTPNAKFATTSYKNGEFAGTANSAENRNELTVSCFPNPATNSISVNIMGDSDQLVDVKLSTIYGHVVFESKFSEHVVHEINVRNYPKGIYVLRVSKSGKTSSVKIVIN